MTKAAYPLKLPRSVKTAAERLAKADGVSLNQWIAVAVAEKIGVVETAANFLSRRAGQSKPADLIDFLDRAPDAAPMEGDALNRAS
ncbi:pilus assembly protein HicB [Caulobacter endophyticus]|uniref:Pilus assembly protein HicB n=1 Tax=Caulobacter endophyticus TaxID=2172652 RepID=A0A2T9K4T4_9CAUL|nr:pilus assembly protein HicB [Caulobacter endophyticus]PVM90992.1 pilus assembly protein HicB [Caulobacter endophyticus]